jgi:Tfp pilus assembly protein PilV
MAIHKNQEGFSILELIAVMAIVVLGMLGLLSLSVQSIRVISFNRSSLMASELAREGVELVINARDTNWIAGNPWNQGFAANGDYTMTYSSSSPVWLAAYDPNNINDNLAKLYQDANGYYKHGVGQYSGFNRIINISNSTSASSTVTSLVQYKDRGAIKQYKLVTILYDWY